MPQTHFIFDSQIEQIGAMPDFSQDIVKNETMFFNSSRDFIRSLKNSTAYNTTITQAFLDTVDSYLLKQYKTIPSYVLDSRVHMLFKGWYAAIPGWHQDDVPRTLKSGQPNYYNPEYKAKHIMALVNGNICPTEFAIGKCELPDIHDDEMYYKKWHPLIEKMCNERLLTKQLLGDNSIIFFDCDSFHQATVANNRGFRWFGRISWDTNRTQNITNEIRRNANVYLPAPMEGW